MTGSAICNLDSYRNKYVTIYHHKPEVGSKYGILNAMNPGIILKCHLPNIFPTSWVTSPTESRSKAIWPKWIRKTSKASEIEYGIYSKVGFPGGSDGKESACNAGDPGLISELGRSPGERNGNSL